MTVILAAAMWTAGLYLRKFNEILPNHQPTNPKNKTRLKMCDKRELQFRKDIGAIGIIGLIGVIGLIGGVGRGVAV
ncbi:MAG: hypothetical protein K2L93_02120, partial [Muribaculaceae bacterium]|nr:hypothetical protein [Muribaculaceae bacterium]